MGVNPHKVVTADFESMKSAGDTAFKAYREESAFVKESVSRCMQLDRQYEASHPGVTMSRTLDDLDYFYDAHFNRGLERHYDRDSDIRRVLETWLESDASDKVTMQSDEVKNRLRSLLTDGIHATPQLSSDHGSYASRAENAAMLAEDMFSRGMPEIVRAMGEVRACVGIPTVTHSLSELAAGYNATRDHLWLLEVQRSDGSNEDADLSDDDSWLVVKRIGETSFGAGMNAKIMHVIQDEMLACRGGVRLNQLFPNIRCQKLTELGDMLHDEVARVLPEYNSAVTSCFECERAFKSRHGLGDSSTGVYNGSPANIDDSFGAECAELVDVYGAVGKSLHHIARAFDDATNIDFVYFGEFRRDNSALDSWMKSTADELHSYARTFGGHI